VPPFLGKRRPATPRNNPERGAHMLHRVTGLVLVAYFLAHASTMGLAFAGQAWAASLSAAITANKLVKFIVASSAAFHGLNGIRLILAEALAIGVGRPGIPRPPYVSATLRSGQRILLHLVAVGFGLAAALAAYTVLIEP